MGKEIDPDKIIRVPITELEKPRGGLTNIIAEHWWVVEDKGTSPCHAIFYRPWEGRGRRHYSYAQANPNKVVAESLLRSLYEPLELGFELRLIPVAFVPIWITGEVDYSANLEPLLKG